VKVTRKSSSQIRAPRWASDLFKDLRDRRLLVPALALIVALIAVPVLLASPAEPPPPPLAALPEGAGAVDAAVLAEQTGIRSYKKRLAELKETNPFEQKFALPTPESVALEEPTSAAVSSSQDSTVASSSTSTSALSETISSSTSSTSDTTIDQTTIDQTTIEDTTIQQTDDTIEVEPTKPELRFFADRVDVKFGPLGHTRDYDGIRHLEFLPDDKAPVIAFVGLAGSGDQAVFSISSDVVETRGEGSCAPKKPSPCEFLTLKEGEERHLKYALDGKTYRLKLRETRIVRIPDPRDG
jgi:hypothetical protein